MMEPYHKIQTLFDRDPENNFKTVIVGRWARREFEYLQNCVWEYTEKIDGTNIRVHFNGKVHFAGKTDNAQIPPHLLKELQAMFPEEKFAEFTDGVTLYGEGYGAKIQKGGGKYIPDKASFILFDVRIGDVFLYRKDVYDVAAKLEIKHVPVLGYYTLREAVSWCSSGFDSAMGDLQPEGLVMRPVVELQDKQGRRIIAKLKLRDFQ